MNRYYPIVQLHNAPPTYVPAAQADRYRLRPANAEPNTELTSLIGVHTGWLPRALRSDDPAQAMLVEKADLAKMTVGSLLYQIIQRERMKDENLRRIAYQEVAIDGEILRLEDSWTTDNRMMSGLEAELIRLVQQKRAEEIECWRDISRLKTNLLEALGLYRDSARRERMVTTGLLTAGGPM